MSQPSLLVRIYQTNTNRCRSRIAVRFCSGLKWRLHNQFVQQFGILFGPKIVPLRSKIFGPNFVPNFLLHRGTIFGRNIIPNHKRNWMFRRLFTQLVFPRFIPVTQQVEEIPKLSCRRSHCKLWVYYCFDWKLEGTGADEGNTTRVQNVFTKPRIILKLPITKVRLRYH